MSANELNTINDLSKFIDGSQKVAFAVLGNKDEKYLWIQKTLDKFQYHSLNKKEKGVVNVYLQKVTGYSRQQVTRLIKQHRDTRVILYKRCKTNVFETKYSKQDIFALAKIDELHGTLNGKATKKLCERAWNIYEDPEYKQLSEISVSHLYNLRKTKTYKNQKTFVNKTKPTKCAIGERRKPEPNNKPGYLRIDTVHQGDLNKQKGVYHINAVDEVTQFEVVCTIEKISEQYLIPVLIYMLEAFPFKILGFHSDNGSEYVNHTVAKLLQKLHVEFTKSRARKSNDNGLVESKNGSIIRNIFGHEYIAQKHADKINNFNKTYLNYYLNYHRPCLFASNKIDKKGKVKKIYKYENVLTPYEKLKSLPNFEKYLKEGVSVDDLDYKAKMLTDAEAAKQMNDALKNLFSEIFNKEQNELLNIQCAS